MELHSRWTRIENGAAAGAIVLSVASYALALGSPVYTDEIAWKLAQGHYFDDGFASRSANLAPSCGIDTYSTPALLVPVRYLDSFINNFLATPGDIRLYGVMLFLVWFAATWVLLRRLLAPVAGGFQVQAGITGAITLGVMPLLMVISRPEQTLLIGTFVFLIFAVDERPRAERPLLSDALRALAVALGGAILVSCHPRALLVLPIVVLASFRIVGRPVMRYAACAIVTLVALVAFTDFNVRYSCPGDPWVRALLDFDSIVLAASTHTLDFYFQHLGMVLLKAPGLFFYLTQFGFNDRYISHMFPPYPFRGLGLVLTTLLGAAVGSLALTGIVVFIRTVVMRIKRRENLIAPAALAASWGVILVSIIARTSRNNYESELLEPLLILNSVLSLWLGRDELRKLLGPARLARYIRAGFATLLVLSIVSQIALLAGDARYAQNTWSGPGYVPGQPLSVAPQWNPRVESVITEAAARCNISAGPDTLHLVVDELTYFAFRHTNTPYLMTYLHPHNWGRGIKDLRLLLASKHSSGVVMGCHWMVPALAARSIQTGKLCCVPKF